MRIAFIWQGFDGRYGQWRDGLWAALELISDEHTVRCFDFPLKMLDEFKPDVVLYWEAPMTSVGKDRENYWAVQRLPYKKALLFAGGTMRLDWLSGFDIIFVESKINEDECKDLGVPYRRAFGVNDHIFRPESQPKVWDGVFPATCASWKRQWLMAEALGPKAAVMGRFQETDPLPFLKCSEFGTLVMPELSAQGVAAMINASHTVINCSDVWGGGQRATLEAMACGVPVIVMSDSPKNMEFVTESGAGVVVDPHPIAIRNAVQALKEHPSVLHSGRSYIESKWTARHYANSLLAGIKDFV